MGARRRFAVLCAILLAMARGGASGDAARTGADAPPPDRPTFGTAAPRNLRSAAPRPCSPCDAARARAPRPRSHTSASMMRIAVAASSSPRPSPPAHGASTFPLHGSVKEHGYYYANIALGDPSPRTFQVIVDTGSTLTYVPCATCAKCGTHTGGTRFDPTGKWLKCKQKECRDGGRAARRRTGRGAAANRCTYSRTYAEGSGVSGDLVRDKMHFGGDIAPDTNGTLDVVFRPSHERRVRDDPRPGSGWPHRTGQQPVRVGPNQLADTHGLPRVFSLCFGSFEGGGALSFGRLPATRARRSSCTRTCESTTSTPRIHVVSTTAMKMGMWRWRPPMISRSDTEPSWTAARRSRTSRRGCSTPPPRRWTRR